MVASLVLANGGRALATTMNWAGYDGVMLQLANGNNLQPQGDQILLACLNDSVTEANIQSLWSTGNVTGILNDLYFYGRSNGSGLGTVGQGTGFDGTFTVVSYDNNSWVWGKRVYVVSLHGGTLDNPGNVTQMGMWSANEANPGSWKEWVVAADNMSGARSLDLDAMRPGELDPAGYALNGYAVIGFPHAAPGAAAVAYMNQVFAENGWGDSTLQYCAQLAYVVLPGDANRDGKVDINDLTRVLTSYNQTGGMDWGTGDFNSDGKVDINDLTIVLTHYNQSVGASAGGIAAVPEPSGLVLLGIAVAGLLACTRRRWS
jgi:hypothetical protein